ncbi:hypothetical protein FN846DRAFT_1009743 [Sphaerosporella brunnea]|uniref:Uncharacterized protein n=1 Tax=Sphaerosporella brunnea TaxID=1250544 RepID=A0A5J5ECF6_9PEZI|nr:hypothetical protein FN846DRAFT_1009743 [Sphaerosporella brunnea]
MRNTPPRVLTEFPIVDDVESFRAILGAILSMHAPYPEYSPLEIDDKNLAPEVDPTVYPICAGKWQLAGHCQLYLYGDDLPCDVSRLLETLMNVVDPKETAREIAYSVMWEIQDSDQFAYVHSTTTTLGNGFTVHFVCSSDLASRDKGNPERDTRARPGRIPRQGNSRMRVDCGGSIAISVTTDGIGINYKHRPIHQRAAVRRIDEELKDIIRTKQFASARELRRYLPADLFGYETFHKQAIKGADDMCDTICEDQCNRRL